VFQKIGLFPEEMQSGGDVFWTGRATAAGFRLVYHAPAEVAHPARRLWPLIRKQYRVGKGKALLYRSEGVRLRDQIWRVGLRMLPRRIGTVRRRLEQKEYAVTPLQVRRAWLASWLAQIATAVGISAGLSASIFRRDDQ